jgi:hypothetical protein
MALAGGRRTYAEAKTEESAILLLAQNDHYQNLLVVRPQSIISSLLYI